MSNQKVYKKGEYLFKEGDKLQNFIFIQAGGVNQCLIKGKKNIELSQLGHNHFLGELALLGATQHPTSAMATSETKTIEVPIEAIKAQYDVAPQFIKLMIRSLTERLKLAMSEVRTARLDKDGSPCPDEFIPQVFGTLFHVANHKGKKQKDNFVEITWTMLRQYSQRILGQSPKRLEQAINILVKLKQAHYNMGKAVDNPDGPDEIQEVIFHDLGVVESFFEYYQYYFYKPGKAEFLKYDDLLAQIAEIMLRMADGAEVDRFGVVGIDYNAFSEAVKTELGINLSGDHTTRFENKGVMTKRRVLENQTSRLEFEIKEVKHTFYSWKILREIDKWNEKGFVDINEKEEKKKKANESACPQCGAGFTAQQKFCAECGASLVAAAKAS